MPLLYGEGDKAFQRLQEEIVRVTDDQSIFAWQCSESSGKPGDRCAVFAPSPDYFKLAAPVVRWIDGPSSSMRLINGALEIELPLLQLESHSGSRCYHAVLNCHHKNDLTGPLALIVMREWQSEWGREGEYFVTCHIRKSERNSNRLTKISRDALQRAKRERLYLVPRSSRHDHATHHRDTTALFDQFRWLEIPKSIWVEFSESSD